MRDCDTSIRPRQLDRERLGGLRDVFLLQAVPDEHRGGRGLLAGKQTQASCCHGKMTFPPTKVGARYPHHVAEEPEPPMRDFELLGLSKTCWCSAQQEMTQGVGSEPRGSLKGSHQLDGLWGSFRHPPRRARKFGSARAEARPFHSHVGLPEPLASLTGRSEAV